MRHSLHTLDSKARYIGGGLVKTESAQVSLENAQLNQAVLPTSWGRRRRTSGTLAPDVQVSEVAELSSKIYPLARGVDEVHCHASTR